MKGFIYLIEIAVAAIIMTVILSVFFSIRIKQGWERAEIISAGSNVLNSIENNKNFFLNILDENFTDINSNMPQNINYGVRILGSPKSNIFIGCYMNCLYLEAMLNPSANYGTVYLNGRWINFSMDLGFDINSGAIPNYYDAIVLINYTNYSDPTINASIREYLKNGGILIAINATESSSNTAFNDIFNLTSGSDSGAWTNFSYYNNSIDRIEKYFLGIGLEAYSNWTIWEQDWKVDYWGGNKINITNYANPADNRTGLVEGSIFDITSPFDSVRYFFMVKKLWSNRAEFQALNKTFTFNDFSEGNIKGMNALESVVGYENHAALTTNNSAIWMSNFLPSSEYSTLLKAAILSRMEDWTARHSITTKDTYTVSSFTSLCCDMPEIAELHLTMWYAI
ncbi:MAG: hypothetical protein V1678_03305 [Candidatus Aenigmatarchaeota archaeon]